MAADHEHEAESTSRNTSHRQPRNQLYRSRGIEVEIQEDDEKVSLALDGVPVEVAHINGKYYSPTAHMYVEFDTLDQVVDQLISTSDEYWTLHPPGEDGGGGGHGNHSKHTGHGEHGTEGNTADSTQDRVDEDGDADDTKAAA